MSLSGSPDLRISGDPMLFTASALRHSLLALALTFALPALAAEKQRIEKEGDIPRFAYAISDPLESVVRDKALFAKATEKMRTDMESEITLVLLLENCHQIQ
jgi:hypothetical protein